MKTKCTETEGWKNAQKRKNETLTRQKEQRILQYDLNPLCCKYCLSILEYKDRKKDFCNRSCAGSFNGAAFPKRKKSNRIIHESKTRKNTGTVYEKICLQCSTAFHTILHRRKYCCRMCSTAYQINRRDEKRKISALSGKASHKTIRDYLIKTVGAKCVLCGWSIMNQFTKKVPIELDHIDGNSDNNTIENSRLVCPNCHSLTATYKGANRGKGRHKRKQRYHDGKSY
jgi:hypothetical protein